MENAQLVGLSRQMALARELDVVANNIANMETAGFKGRSSIFQEYLSPTARAETFPKPDQRVSYVWDRGTALNYQQGMVERTGNLLDVAIRGKALFTVRSGNNDFYTRDGSFTINGKGELVNGSGLPVQTDQGTVTFSDQDTDVRILSDGTITSIQQGQPQTKGKLKLVTFPDPQSLQNAGGNLFSSSSQPTPATPEQMQLEPGAIEKSNVNPITEMTRMIEINRNYQAVATMISNRDSLRQTAISRLADQQS